MLELFIQSRLGIASRIPSFRQRIKGRQQNGARWHPPSELINESIRRLCEDYYLFVRRRTCGLWDVVLRTDVTLKRLFSMVEHYTARAGKKYTGHARWPQASAQATGLTAPGIGIKMGARLVLTAIKSNMPLRVSEGHPPASLTCMHKGPDLSEHIIVVPKRCVHVSGADNCPHPSLLI